MFIEFILLSLAYYLHARYCCTYVSIYTHIRTYTANSLHMYVPIIAATRLLAGPTPYLLTAVTMTTTVPVNTPSGSDGGVNVSVVVELLTFIIVPL